MDKRLEQMKEKENNLSYEKLMQYLDYNPDTGIFTWKKSKARRLKSGDKAGSLHKTGYVQIVLDGKSYWAHRLAWFYFYKEWPHGKNYQIDHINGIKSDNRISNLRLSTNRKNTQNHALYAHNTSGVNGVCFNVKAQKWCAYIKTNELKNKRGVYRQKHLGSFVNFEDAVAARKMAEQKYNYNN